MVNRAYPDLKADLDLALLESVYRQLNGRTIREVLVLFSEILLSFTPYMPKEFGPAPRPVVKGRELFDQLLLGGDFDGCEIVAICAAILKKLGSELQTTELDEKE